jgi:hypothetical protein
VVRELLQCIRNLKAWSGKPPVITGELLGETYIAGCDGLFNNVVDDHADSIPLFQAVHKDHTTEIGESMRYDEMANMDTFMAKMSFCLVRGRQLGEFSLNQCECDILKPDLCNQFGKLREFCKVRRAGQEFLFFGELLRTPDLGAVGKVKRHWVSFRRSETECNLPSVLAECYRSPDGKIGIVLGNHTDKEQKISIPWNTKDWGFKPGDDVFRQDCLDGKWSDKSESKLTSAIEVSVPAYSPMIIKLSKPKDVITLGTQR